MSKSHMWIIFPLKKVVMTWNRARLTLEILVYQVRWKYVQEIASLDDAKSPHRLEDKTGSVFSMGGA